MAIHLVFLGPPGAGKGTIAAMLAEKTGAVHISTGDIFRYNVQNKTELGQLVESILARGEYVPDEITNRLVEDRLKKDDLKMGYILDGYPRTMDQVRALQGFSTVSAVINFVLEEKHIIERLSGRLMCQNCHAGYHATNLPPQKPGICDKCGGVLITRADDKPEAIKKRLQVYQDNTAPLVDYYAQTGLLRNIDASQTTDQVLQNLLAAIR